MTTNALPLCPQCGHAIPADAANGLCPRCVFAKAMAPTADGITGPHVPPSLESVRAAFPHLEVTGLIGSGGMGSVFKARQPQLDRFVALKILPSELANQSGFSTRFQREAQALARLSHPHIVTVHDFGQTGGFFYLLMEFVDGVNLRQLLQSKRLTPKEALSIVPPICEALQCAHDHGIVHRDIKPENLLIDKAGLVKIADFGIAKMILSEDAKPAYESEHPTAASVSLPLGTPDYAAPEQSNGTADHRADIYSLGVVLYEMLTGERPTAKLEAPSKRVQVDIRIDEIVLRALEKTPELRFATAADFRTQVEALVQLPEQTQIDYSRFNRDPANWHFYAFYFCREDPRLIVPKRIAGLGWTVNLARPLAIPFVLAVCGVVWSAFELARDRDPLHAYDKWTLAALIFGLAFFCHRLSNPSPSPQHVGWLELPGASSWARRYLLLPSCLAGGAYAAHLFYFISTAAGLPDRVATHFGKGGLPNGWMTKTEHLVFMGLMPVGMTAFLALALWLNIKNPSLLSLPNRDFWLAPERRKRTTFMLAGTNLVLSAILTGFMSTVNHVILSANIPQPPKLVSTALLLPVVFLLSLLALWGVSFSFRFAHKDETALASATPRKPRVSITFVIIVGLGLLLAAVTCLRSPTAPKESRVGLKYIDANLVLDHIKAEHPELASVVLRTETHGNTVILDSTSASLEPLQKYLTEIDHPPEGIVLSGIVTEFLPGLPADPGKVVARPTVYTLLGNDSSILVTAKDGLQLNFSIKVNKGDKRDDESFVLGGTVTESVRDAPAQARKIFSLPTLHAAHGGSVVFTHRLQDGRDIGLTIKLLNSKPPPLKAPAAVLGASAR